MASPSKSAPTSTHVPSLRTPITDRMVERVMTLTVLALEEACIPAQGAGDLLFVYATGSEITHNVRRTLEVFDGDVNEAITNICAFVIDGVVGDLPR